jgi:RPA family protein
MQLGRVRIARSHKHHAHEKPARLRIVELMRIGDVAPVIGQETCYPCDESQAIIALKAENVTVGHDESLSLVLARADQRLSVQQTRSAVFPG